ncbi:hypothetical protein [Anatilimnocola floriformis]|uniref:hypothetical protein n=1 Tax=Anatilimnocola floriformis TaxID=2948575 RepID=UPI0020C2D048|nr:hypothetical protein [Anatilimnocola floriformis]
MVNFTDWSYITRPSASISQAKEDEYVAAGKRVVRVGEKCFIYSNENLLTQPAFSSVAIPITEATLMDGKLVSFKFVGDKWYKDLPAGFTDKGIVGEIDLTNSTGKWTAKYQQDANGTIAIYDVTATLVH